MALRRNCSIWLDQITRDKSEKINILHDSFFILQKRKQPFMFILWNICDKFCLRSQSTLKTFRLSNLFDLNLSSLHEESQKTKWTSICFSQPWSNKDWIHFQSVNNFFVKKSEINFENIFDGVLSWQIYTISKRILHLTCFKIICVCSNNKINSLSILIKLNFLTAWSMLYDFIRVTHKRYAFHFNINSLEKCRNMFWIIDLSSIYYHNFISRQILKIK